MAIVQTTDRAVQEHKPTCLEQAILVDWYQDTLQRFLGSLEAVDAFSTEIFTQARKAPKLYSCTVESARFTIARVASLRLNPAIPNEVSLIPRNMKQANGTYADEMTVIYGYGGLRKLAMRSPEVKDVLTAAVCANDTYHSPISPVVLPLHTLPARFQPRGRVEGYYAAVELVNGNWRTWSMSVAEVEAHAKRYVHDLDRAPAWHKGERPDVEDGLTPFDKMGLKTCLRMLLNGRDIPLTAEVADALVVEAHALHVETPGECLGYGRDGSRPAITMGNGITIDDLRGDLFVDQDALQETLQRARGTTRAGALVSEPLPGAEGVDARYQLALVQIRLGWGEADVRAWENKQARRFKKSFADLPDEAIRGLVADLEGVIAEASPGVSAEAGEALASAESSQTGARATWHPGARQGVLDDTSVWRQILRANLAFLPAGPLQDEAIAALRVSNFSEQRGNELGNIASDLASKEGD